MNYQKYQKYKLKYINLKKIKDGNLKNMKGGVIRILYETFDFNYHPLIFEKIPTIKELFEKIQEIDSESIDVINDYAIQDYKKKILYDYNYDGDIDINDGDIVQIYEINKKWTADEWTKIMKLLSDKFTKIEWIQYLSMKPKKLTLNAWYLLLNENENIDDILRENIERLNISNSINLLLNCKPNNIPIDRWLRRVMYLMIELLENIGFILPNEFFESTEDYIIYDYDENPMTKGIYDYEFRKNYILGNIMSDYETLFSHIYVKTFNISDLNIPSNLSNWTLSEWDKVTKNLNTSKFPKIKWMQYLSMKPNNLTLENWYLKLNKTENDVEVDKILKENKNSGLYFNDFIIPSEIIKLFDYKPIGIGLREWFEFVHKIIITQYDFLIKKATNYSTILITCMMPKFIDIESFTKILMPDNEYLKSFEKILHVYKNLTGQLIEMTTIDYENLVKNIYTDS